jgi:hypothetical protein
MLKICFVFWVMSSALDMRPVCSFQTLATHFACYKVTIRNGSQSKERKFNVTANPRKPGVIGAGGGYPDQ